MQDRPLHDLQLSLTELLLGGGGEVWSELLDLPLDGDAIAVSAVRLRFGADGPGIRSWALAGVAAGSVDGLDVHETPAEPEAPEAPEGGGALRLDQLVVLTPDFERTAAALAAAGLPLRREQTLTRGGRTLHQGFRRVGEPVLELVQSDEVLPGPARFWGLGFSVERLEEWRERLGGRLGEIRPAVQPGRRIAALSGGVRGVAVAFLDG